jgi:transposase
MAASQNQLSSAELQELIKLLQVVEGLQEAAAQQEANRIASTTTAKRQLNSLREEYHDLTDDISDSLKAFKTLVSELGNASSGVTITTRAYKGIISIAEKLQLHQKDIVDLNEKDLKKLQEKLAIKRQDLINSKEVLEQDKERLERESQFKEYDKARVDHEIEILKRKQTNRGLNKQELDQLKQLNKENNNLERQLKNINTQLFKARGYLAEMPGIEQGIDENFKAIEQTIRRIQIEIKEQNSLLGLGGSIIAGLGTALDKLGFGKLSQILGISQATSAMEEFSSKIVKKRSEEANLRNSIERTQQELEFKGYSQVLQNLEREKFLEEEIAKNRKGQTDAQIKTRFGGTVKNQLLELEALRTTISEKDRELHQQAQINNQNKVTLGQLTAQNAKYAGMNGHIAVLAKGIKSMGSSLLQNLNNPIAQATFVVTQLVDAFKTIDNGAGKLAKGMNISYGEALKVREQFTSIAANSDSIFVTSEKLGESYLAISQNLGANVQMTEKDLETFTKLREQAGYTNEELISINKISMATGRSVDDTVAGFMGAGKALAIQKGLSINIKQLMKETANVSNAIKLSLGATPEALAKAAIKVKELGINLDQADKIASSLLQFESSITAELEAELLTGKEINLENARYYALMGDIGAMAEEINKEIGGSAEFTKMNRIQQEAYAKAVGMSREELANSLVEQEALSKLGRSLTEEEKNAYEFAKQKYGEEKAAKMLGEKQLDTMMDQANVQERFTAAVERLKETFVSIVDGPLGSMLNGIASLLSNATALRTIFGAIAGIMMGRMLLGTISLIRNLGIALGLSVARAAAEVTAAEAISMGFATVAILAGLGAVMGALSSYGASDTSGTKTQYVKDGAVDPNRGLVISKPEGSIGGEVQLKHLAQGIPGDKAYLTTNDLTSTAAPSSVPQVTPSQSITATPSLGMPSSTEESQQLNTSISKLTETSQLQIEELKKLNQENKTLNETRTAQEEKNTAVQTKSSSSQVTILTKIAKILETQLTMQVAKDALSMIPVIGGMLGNIAGAGIGGKALYDLNQTPKDSKSTTTTPKLADGGLITKGGMAQVDTGEVYLGKNSSEVFKDMYVSLNKISDNTTNKLNATKTLNKISTTDDLARSTSTFINNIDELTKSVNVNTNATKLNAVATLDKVNLANLNNIEKASETTKVKEADKIQETGKTKEANIFSKIGETIKNSFADSANIIAKITSTDTAKTKTPTITNSDKTIASTLTTSASTFVDTANKLNTVTKATTSDLATMASSSMSDAVKSTNNANVTKLNAINTLDKTTATDLNKSISALTSETTKSNTADTLNKTIVTDLTKSVSSFTNDINKSTDTANVTNLNAANALNKTSLTSILDTVDKTQLIKDVTNFEEERIKNNETNLNATNLFQPTPLNNTLETKLITAPNATSAATTSTTNSEVSTVINNVVAESSAITAQKLDQAVEILTQILHKNSNTYLDGRLVGTSMNLSSART